MTQYRPCLTLPLHLNVFLLTCISASSISHAQTASQAGADSILQKRYEAAQRFQAANDLNHAAEQYRIFIADALGEVAIGRAQADQYDKAQDDFDEALQLVPNFPMMQLAYARAALQSGRFEHAEVLSKDLLRKFPDNKAIATGAHSVLGRALLKTEKAEEAKAQFEAAVQFDPTFENGYELAIASLNLGDIEATRKIFAEMLTSFGDTPTIHMYFGQAYGNSDFQSDAVSEFQKAIVKDARLPGVHYSLAVAYLATAGNSRLKEAEQELGKEIEITPNDGVAYAALGHLLATHAETPEERVQAEADLKKAIKLDPTDPDGYLYLAQLYVELKRVPEAEDALRQSIALTHDVSRNAFQVQKAHYLLGRLLAQTGDQQGSDAEFAASQSLMKQNLSRDQNRLSDYLQEKRPSSAVAEFHQPMQAVTEDKPSQTKSVASVDDFEKRITPAVADSYNNLGAIAGSERNSTLALRYLRHAAEWAPALPGLDFNWGRAAFEAGAYAEAVGPLTRHLLAQPQDDNGRRLLGLSHFMLKQYGDALQTLEPLANNSGEAPSLKFAYADSLLKQGNVVAAIPLLEQLDEAGSGSPDVHAALGEAYASLGRLQLSQGDPKDAVNSLQRAVALDPGNAPLRETLQQTKASLTKR